MGAVLYHSARLACTLAVLEIRAMQLNSGMVAPELDGETSAGGRFRLREQRGRKVWLAFFRYVDCMFCNFRIHEIAARLPDLQGRGLVFAGVFQSPREPLAQFVAEKKVPLTLVADPAEELYALYGLETSLAGFLSPRNLPGLAKGVSQGFGVMKHHGSRTRLPADFLIDEGGVIRAAYYGRAISDAIKMTEVEAFLA